MKMTQIERVAHEMALWVAFIADGGDMTIATTGWFE